MLVFSEAWYPLAYSHGQAKIEIGLWENTITRCEQDGAGNGLSPNAFLEKANSREPYHSIKNAVNVDAIMRAFPFYLGASRRYALGGQTIPTGSRKPRVSDAPIIQQGGSRTLSSGGAAPPFAPNPDLRPC